MKYHDTTENNPGWRCCQEGGRRSLREAAAQDDGGRSAEGDSLRRDERRALLPRRPLLAAGWELVIKLELGHQDLWPPIIFLSLSDPFVAHVGRGRRRGRCKAA